MPTIPRSTFGAGPDAGRRYLAQQLAADELPPALVTMHFAVAEYLRDGESAAAAFLATGDPR